MKRSFHLQLIAVCGLAAPLSAQTVTVRGAVYDSLYSRPLPGAFVAIGARTATTDSAGRFSIDSVVPGTHRVTAQHDAIDRLGIAAIGTQARITDGTDLVRVALPSFATMWRTVCGPTPPVADTGFIFGSLRRAPGARGKAPVVTVAWRDIVSNGRTVAQKQKMLEVDADSLGNYTLCGVPTQTGLTIQATSDSAESGIFDLDPMDTERVARRDLAMGVRLERVVATQRGARLFGVVRADSGGGPLANARVTVDGAAEATTDEKGEFRFADLLPGSHLLYVKRIGYAEVERRVDLEEAEERRHDVVLARVTMLDSVAVVGKFMARDEQMRVFEENRRLGLGVFMTAAELDKARGRPLSSTIGQFRGIFFPAYRPGADMVPQTRRGIKSIMGGGGCRALVYGDGVRLRAPFSIDDYPPETLAGVEWYPGGGSIPAEYNVPGSQCGVLVLHSRYKAGK